MGIRLVQILLIKTFPLFSALQGSQSTLKCVNLLSSANSDHWKYDGCLQYIMLLWPEKECETEWESSCGMLLMYVHYIKFDVTTVIGY